MASRRVLASAIAVLVLVGGCSGGHSKDVAGALPNDDSKTVQLRPTILGEMPHDPTAFTQGLELDGSALYEGTGNFGQSQLRELDPQTGAVRRAVLLPKEFFGEGITVVDGQIWQLTWRNKLAIQWAKDTFTRVGEAPVSGEGWGLCRDGDRLIRSDGSDRLFFHDPADFAEIGSVAVTRDGKPARGLNELECADGLVWANVWPTDEIVRIDPVSGRVTASVDAAGLPVQRGSGNVLNGIAYLGNDEFLVTGKNWPTIFRVTFDPV